MIDQPDDRPREGEIVSDGPLAADAWLMFIGRIETPWTTRADCPRRGDAAPFDTLERGSA